MPTIFGIVGLSAGALGALWIGMGLPRPVCHFRMVTGVPCPTCGTTRMGEALLRGELGTALAMNPLVFVVLTILAIWALIGTVDWLRGTPARRLIVDRGERLALRVGAVTVLAGGWIYQILSGV